MSDLREVIAHALHREFEDSSHDYEECFRPESWLNTADVVLGVVHEHADKMWWCELHQFPAHPRPPIRRCKFAALVVSANPCQIVRRHIVALGGSEKP